MLLKLGTEVEKHLSNVGRFLIKSAVRYPLSLVTTLTIAPFLLAASWKNTGWYRAFKQFTQGLATCAYMVYPYQLGIKRSSILL